MRFTTLKRLRVMAASALVAVTLAAVLPSAYAGPRGPFESLVDTLSQGTTSTVPAAGSMEVAFSPSGGAEALVVKVIDSAQRDIRMLAYSFTNAKVVAALLRAEKRGVDVRLVADEKNNLVEDRSGKARAALSALATAGVDVRTISAYPIHHDKVLVSDSKAVQTGSFNYSAAAESRNSENVLVVWNNPQLAKTYLAHFERNYHQSTAFKASYSDAGERSTRVAAQGEATHRVSGQVEREIVHQLVRGLFR